MISQKFKLHILYLIHYIQVIPGKNIKTLPVNSEGNT